jgi:hypothetical protein
MKLNCAQFITNKLPQHGPRLCCLLSVVLCIFLSAAVPAVADPITIRQVVQTLNTSHGIPDLRINTLVVTQDPGKVTQQSSVRSEATAQSGGKNESLISGVTVGGSGHGIGIEDIEDGEVEGTICDCGEIFIAGGGFPKWPFLFLAAVPLAFIHECDSCSETSTPTPTPTPPTVPTPTPTPPGVPEPASLFLFGTGVAALGAGLRRRYANAKLAAQLEALNKE